MDLPELEAASINLNLSGATEHIGEVLPSGVFFAENVTMNNMIQLAWSVRANAVIGGPDWFAPDHFDIDGKVPPNTPDDAVRLMLQRYLASVFKLAVQLEQRPRDVFTLSVSDGGPRLQKASTPGEADSDCAISPDSGKHRAVCTNITMVGLPERLPELAPGYIDRPVVDRTGILGTWNLGLE